jgi:hypothetical protein
MDIMGGKEWSYFLPVWIWGERSSVIRITVDDLDKMNNNLPTIGGII